MASPGGCSEKRARDGPPNIVADHEVGFTGEYVEGVDVILVRVRIDTFEVRAEGHLDDRELGQLGLDAVEGGLVFERLACARELNDGFFEGPASVFGRVELIEMLVATTAENVAEAHARRVDVEEDRRRAARVPEGVHDIWRSGYKGLWPALDSGDLGAESEVDLAFEGIERVRVLPVDVRIRPFLARLIAEPRDDQLFELAEDPQRPLGAIGGRLAVAGA